MEYRNKQVARNSSKLIDMKKFIITIIGVLFTLFSFAANRFWVGGTGTWDNLSLLHWSATSGGTGGSTVPGSGDAVIFDALSGGGTVTPNYNISVASVTMGAFTGTLDFSANNNSPTIPTFNISGTGTRTLNMGNGTWTVNAWIATTITNLSINANLSQLTFAGTGATMTGATLTYYNVSFTGGGAIVVSGSKTFNNLTVTGVGSGDSFSLSATITVNGTVTVNGNSSLNLMQFISSVSNTTRILQFNNASFTNGAWVDMMLTSQSTASTWSLNEDLVMTGNSGVNINGGTFSTANHAITSKNFNSNSGTRTLNFGSSLITLNGTGTVFNINSTIGLTLNPGTSTIKITDASSATKSILGGAFTLNNIWLSGGGTGAFILGNTNSTFTFNNIKIDPASTITIPAGKTIAASSLTISGTAGNLNTFRSTTSGAQWFLSVPPGTTISADYLDLQDSHALGGALFYAGTHSNNSGNNIGWVFKTPNSAKRNFFLTF
jgi:hypothetical protein